MKAQTRVAGWIGMVGLLAHLTGFVQAQDITNGATEVQVREALGKPRGRVQTGRSTYLSYDRGFVALMDGLVTNVALRTEKKEVLLQETRDWRDGPIPARAENSVVKTQAQTDREAQRIQRAPPTPPAAPASNVTSSVAAPGAATDGIEKRIAETEQAIAALSAQPEGSKEASFVRNRSLAELNLKLDILNAIKADPAGISNRVAEVESKIADMSDNTSLTKEESSVQGRELRQLRQKLDFLREQQALMQ